jgi:hypothetical protein
MVSGRATHRVGRVLRCGAGSRRLRVGGSVHHGARVFDDHLTLADALEVLVNGSWTVVKASAPSDADPANPYPPLTIPSFACESVGLTCAAVGSYPATPIYESGALGTFGGGTWSVEKAPLPADVPSSASSVLGAVSCGSSESARPLAATTTPPETGSVVCCGRTSRAIPDGFRCFAPRPACATPRCSGSSSAPVSGEALALPWSDVDLDRGEARITGSLVRIDGQLVVAETKTVRGRRVVSLSPAMVALLTSQRAAQAAERLRAANLCTDSGSSSPPSSATRPTLATCCGR